MSLFILKWMPSSSITRNIERNGRKVAIIGAGPAGLAAANQLNGKGYTVTVFDKNEAPGGLLRYGIPNFKLHKPSGRKERRSPYSVRLEVSGHGCSESVLPRYNLISGRGWGGSPLPDVE